MKVKPEKIAGIVALSYLVLIPAGAAYFFVKLKEVDDDVNTMWQYLNMDPEEAADTLSMNKIKRKLGLVTAGTE